MRRTDYRSGVYSAGDSVYVTPSRLFHTATSGSKAALVADADLTEENFQLYKKRRQHLCAANFLTTT